MAQIFHPSFNTFSRASIFGALFAVAGLLWVLARVERSDYMTQVRVVRDQPVPFSHQHHVSGVGLDCRYCHWPVEESSFAGIPPTQVCMNCHSQIWNEAPTLEPVRASFRTGDPIRWTRVHDLPDYAYFNHSIHVKKGIGCTSCHGRVDKMPLMWKEAPLTMEWCLDCHRNPALHIRPRDEVFNMDYEPKGDQLEIGTRLVKEYDVRTSELDNCSMCHR